MNFLSSKKKTDRNEQSVAPSATRGPNKWLNLSRWKKRSGITLTVDHENPASSRNNEVPKLLRTALEERKAQSADPGVRIALGPAIASSTQSISQNDSADLEGSKASLRLQAILESRLQSDSQLVAPIDYGALNFSTHEQAEVIGLFRQLYFHSRPEEALGEKETDSSRNSRALEIAFVLICELVGQCDSKPPFNSLTEENLNKLALRFNSSSVQSWIQSLAKSDIGLFEQASAFDREVNVMVLQRLIHDWNEMASNLRPDTSEQNDLLERISDLLNHLLSKEDRRNVWYQDNKQPSNEIVAAIESVAAMLQSEAGILEKLLSKISGRHLLLIDHIYGKTLSQNSAGGRSVYTFDPVDSIICAIAPIINGQLEQYYNAITQLGFLLGIFETNKPGDLATEAKYIKEAFVLYLQCDGFENLVGCCDEFDISSNLKEKIQIIKDRVPPIFSRRTEIFTQFLKGLLENSDIKVNESEASLIGIFATFGLADSFVKNPGIKELPSVALKVTNADPSGKEKEREK